MVRPTSKKIKKHITINELNNIIIDETNERTLIKLKFIKYLYKNLSIPNASKKIGISKPTGYKWLENWNKSGYNGLKIKHSSGRPSKLTKIQQNEIKIFLNEKSEYKRTFKIKNLLKIIKKKYGVEYSKKQIREIVKKWGYNYWIDIIFDND